MPPSNPSSLGPWLVGAGLLLVAIGIGVWTGALSWLGRLPGDLRIERDGFRLYVPLVSMLVVSAALSLVAWLVRRFL